MTREQCILLVEDSDEDALLLERAMRKAGITTPLHRVEDGEVACEYLSGNGAYADRQRYPLPSLALFDIKLPRRSGLELLRWVRQQPALRKLVVIMLTSSREHRDVEEAYANGANSYLVKPIAPAEMQELIKTLGLYWLKYNESPALQVS